RLEERDPDAQGNVALREGGAGRHRELMASRPAALPELAPRGARRAAGAAEGGAGRRAAARAPGLARPAQSLKEGKPRFHLAAEPTRRALRRRRLDRRRASS